jgi:hypothetical protein
MRLLHLGLDASTTRYQKKRTSRRREKSVADSSKMTLQAFGSSGAGAGAGASGAGAAESAAPPPQWQDGAGAQQLGAGAQQVGAGSQQETGAASQHVTGAQQTGAQQTGSQQAGSQQPPPNRREKNPACAWLAPTSNTEPIALKKNNLRIIIMLLER